MVGIFIGPSFLRSETIKREDAPLRVYIDENECDLDFIKTEIPYVDYVLDRAAAEVHIFQSTLPLTGGGREHTVYFVGQKYFDGLKDTLVFASCVTDSEDHVRRQHAQIIKIGLVRYLARTKAVDDIIVKMPSTPPVAEIRDKWNYWIFNLRINTDLYGEQSYVDQSVYSYFTASRTTAAWKTEAYCHFGYYRTSYEIDSMTSIESIKKNYGLNYYIARSIGDHWSAGAGFYNYSDTYYNKKYTFFVFPAVEHSFFPYSQATSRELRMVYKIGYVYNAYFDTTIYNKIEEKLVHQTLSITLDAKQRWGSISTTISGSCYLHDITKNGLRGYLYFNMPVYKGFSINLHGYASMIHDQLSLVKGDLTPEEIILRIKQLGTQYDYSVRFGVGYTFGSIRSKIVNPRFGYGL
ncbi:hypothetical protein A2Y85_01145 [candidate division WOR-3 bacterium RBG_13_43_14]|uniref:Uncharacterized protein n=1 Tax=candidate division WOR-3 bacterium RBG_13_43_14 TaxID=1802590 RepID=A0A1F4UFS7_UNCW3|nr:MAG: hypothetical protein A2Y85_01145 [candidate division WOR-3 bacterium RBG_13_43_14]